jgi:integrase
MLSRQSLTILNELRGITGGGEGYQGFLFPSIRTRQRPISENTLNEALRRLGYSGDEMTAHGFRATASTLLNESGKWSIDAIERALAHGHSDAMRCALFPWPALAGACRDGFMVERLSRYIAQGCGRPTVSREDG